MSASADVQEREDEEWKQEVLLLHHSMFIQLFILLLRISVSIAFRVSFVFRQVAQQLSAVMQALQMVHSSVHALQVRPPLPSCTPRSVPSACFPSHPIPHSPAQHERENDDAAAGGGSGLIRGDADTARPASAYFA